MTAATVSDPGSTGRGEWTRPGVFEVAPGVHRVPLPLPNDGLRAVNVYVVHAADGPVLIDSGWAIPEARSALLDGLGALGWQLSDVRRFLVTHIHRDHYQQAVTLREELGTPVALGAGERESIEVLREPGRPPLHQQIGAMRALGADDLADLIAAHLAADRTVDELEWALPDQWLEAGPVQAGPRQLDVVPTPGHTRGHVVFHDLDAGLLFAGDHVLPTITPSIGFEPVLSPNPLGDFLASLALVRSRPDARLLPAHGPVTDSVHARVDELVAHHGARLDETERAVEAGAATAFEVAGRLRWTRRERELADLDPFNQMLAVAETGAHLELLVAQGRVEVEVSEGARHYSPT
ncbi:MAG TPA: MBL fold metallo-hydrolase [Mycobacteriales bacterium]|nr:MBL fold metallo-hydrolase [Mycobacteriales bacterium]